MARRSARISSRTLSSTPQPVKRVSLSHDEPIRVPRTVPAKLASLREIEDIPGSFPQSPTEEPTPSKKVRMSTPQRAAAIVPPREEMHPQAHHKTMPEAHADARWLGFSEREPKTSAADKTSLPRLQMTPSKATATPKISATPVFEFTFQREQSLELSPAAKKMMMEKRDEALRLKEQMKADITEGTANGSSRVIATPKSKRGRFSDAHNEQFQKMDSIAGHASAFRKDPSRLAPTPGSVTTLPASAKSLKRSPSKADLDSFSATPTKSARKQAPAMSSEDTSPRKRARFEAAVEPEIVLKTAPATPSRLPQPATPSRSIARTPLASSKPVHQPSLLTRSPARASIFGGAASSSGQPLLARTPLKPSSAARPQPDAKSTFADSPARSQLGNNNKISFLTPTKWTTIPESGTTTRNKLQERFEKLRATPIKSILRTPQRLYSDDPAKIAAGTHLATPPQRAGLALLRAPATAPVRKHVDFSSSTKAREATKKANVATIFRAGGTQGSAKAEDLAPITYPELPAVGPVAPATSPGRRQSAGPLDFTFRAGGDIVFAPSPSPKRKSLKQSPSGFTIRAVVEEPEPVLTTASSKKRKMAFENQSSIEHAQLSPTMTLGSKKRKFDYENEMAEKEAELEDKENIPERPVKRLKASQSPAPVVKRAASVPVEAKKRATLGVKPKAMVGKAAAKPVAKKAGSTISMARLNALAMPKKR